MPAPATERFLSRPAIACVIHLHDPAALLVPSHETLQAVFGLTQREADLAVELVRFADLAAAATEAGMAFNTARVHLQNIFRKCAVSSQVQLVRLFSNLV
jgi:DNA-binding CsgD family transcriptional regulator